ncbi:probable RNA 3'-terminal phosphate cyclase-like protein [Rutidosis leptorrhynchoides]|uniref:probable RNA 3'-terminal phosphate cyclase-like protein n=1 Tax=Rutidosis leptorrhynchoides TaxID=125765 RepID=UPI003A99D7A7
MGKIDYRKLKGSQNMRVRLVLATLTSTPIQVEDIRLDETIPGLRPHEVSLLRLIERICDDCIVQINDTGTKFKYKPGIIVGGKCSHDCGTSRSIAYFLEPLILLGLFAKKPLSIRLTGITNDSKDPSVDTFRSTTLPLLSRFGVPSEGLGLKIVSRGVPPLGGGVVQLSLPIVHSLKAVNLTDVGMIGKIRGVTFSTKVSVQFENTMVHAARGIFNNLLPNVFIFTDHRSGDQAGESPGYGISLVAHTTTGCCISVDTAVSHERKEDVSEMEDEKPMLTPPDEVGENIACALLEEIEQGGVVDSTHQGLLFLLCALCPGDMSKVRVGKLSPHGIETLRVIRDFLRITFDIKPDPATGTVIVKGLGSGLTNLSRKVS